jgi:hypothetical protein
MRKVDEYLRDVIEGVRGLEADAICRAVETLRSAERAGCSVFVMGASPESWREEGLDGAPIAGSPPVEWVDGPAGIRIESVREGDVLLLVGGSGPDDRLEAALDVAEQRKMTVIGLFAGPLHPLASRVHIGIYVPLPEASRAAAVRDVAVRLIGYLWSLKRTPS